MLSFFRNFAKSPLGLGLFAIIIVAFVVTLYESPVGPNATLASGSIAEVGGEQIGETEMTRRVQNALEAARRDQPQLDMASFVAQGGVEQTAELVVNGRALELFAKQQGMVATKKLVDGEIASIAAFAGPTGQFDRTTFLNLLAQRRISEAQLRDDFAREALTKALVLPASGAARAPQAFGERYGAVLMEARSGSVAAIPSEAFADGSPPSDADLDAYYRKNIARFTVPERRAFRYAAFDRARFAAKAQPSDADVAKAYAAQSATYAGSERRSFTQVIVPAKADADAIAARVHAGAALADAARGVKRDPITVPATDRSAFAKLTSDAVAAAAFGTAKGQLARVERSGLGFHVVRVDSIAEVAATPLSAVRDKIAADLATANEAKAIADFVARIEDAVADNATFDEVVKQFGLTATTTPPLTATGKTGEGTVLEPNPAVQTLLGEAFRAEIDDDPNVAALPGATASPGAPPAGYALWKLDRIVPPAPVPLDKVRNVVLADLTLERGAKAAKAAADRVAAAVNTGAPLAQALGTLGKRLPPPNPVTASRIELARAERVPPPLALLFAMPEKRARVLEIQGRQGWYVVYLDRITRGDPKQAAGLIEATQRQLSQAVGAEYVDQFARAARATVGAKIDQAAVARLKQRLLGTGQ